MTLSLSRVTFSHGVRVRRGPVTSVATQWRSMALYFKFDAADPGRAGRGNHARPGSGAR